MSENRLLRISQVAEITGFSTSTIRNLVRGSYMVSGKRWIEYDDDKPKFPQPVRFGKQLRYREREVNRWLKAVGA